MKSKPLAAAFSEIDDKFLAEADSLAPAKKTGVLRWCAAAAACAAVALFAIGLSIPRGAEILVNGRGISAGENISAPLHNNSSEASPRTVQAAFAAQAIFTEPVDIALTVCPHGKANIAVSEGAITLLSEGGEAVSCGAECTLTKTQDILWSIPEADYSAKYSMTVSGSKTSETLTLFYTDNGWTLVLE